MLVAALLALTPHFAFAPQDPPKPPPAEEVVEEAIAKLKKAYAQRELAPKLEAIAGAADLADKEVLQTLAKGMKEPEPEVKTAVLEALRWSEHPQALEELHGLYKRDKKLVKDEDLFPVLLKSIGQHSSKESIAILCDNPLQNTDGKVMEARIFGLARIREERSVEELFGMLQLVGKGKTASQMDEFRIAMMRLTGVDKGQSRKAWTEWWSENKKTFEVLKEAPRLPKKLQRRWDYYWGEEHIDDRREKREDRGGDE